MEKVDWRRGGILLLAPLIVSVILRVYPFLLYRVPWGTDGWPLFHNTISLIQYSPTRLGGNPAFDNYNIYWPGVSLYGAVASILTGVPPLRLMPLLIPFVASLTTLMFFTVVFRLTRNLYIASAASVLFAASSFDSIFTASVTKETFAYPIFVAALLPLLRKFSKKSLLTFVVLSFGVLLSHYALAFLLFLVGASVPIMGITLGRFPGAEGTKRLFLPSVLGVLGLVYFYLYAYPSVFVITFPETQLVSMAAWIILTAGILAYVLTTKHARSLDFAFIGLVVLIIGISTRFAFAPFAPTPSLGLTLLFAPYIVVTVLAMSGFRMLSPSPRSVFVTGWLSVPLALGGFSLFATPEGIGIIYRLLTFVYGPAAFLASVALVGVAWSKFKRWKAPFVTCLVILVILTSSYQSYDSVVLHSNLLGGQWVYFQSDITSASWAQQHIGINGSLLGDARILYLYTSYEGVPVNAGAGYVYLLGLTSNLTHPLVTYSLMRSDGFDLNNFGQPLPQGWPAKLSSTLSLVYNNGNDLFWV